MQAHSYAIARGLPSAWRSWWRHLLSNIDRLQREAGLDERANRGHLAHSRPRSKRRYVASLWDHPRIQPRWTAPFAHRRTNVRRTLRRQALPVRPPRFANETSPDRLPFQEATGSVSTPKSRDERSEAGGLRLRH